MKTQQAGDGLASAVEISGVTEIRCSYESCV
jgi:hypothetical protein